MKYGKPLPECWMIRVFSWNMILLRHLTCYRNLQKQAASREKPGGVRTAPASLEKLLQRAVIGKSGEEATEAMDKILDSRGLGPQD